MPKNELDCRIKDVSSSVEEVQEAENRKIAIDDLVGNEVKNTPAWIVLSIGYVESRPIDLKKSYTDESGC